MLHLIYVSRGIKNGASMHAAELKILRRRAGLSQSELADAIGMARETIGLMERGAAPIEKRTETAVLNALREMYIDEIEGVFYIGVLTPNVSEPPGCLRLDRPFETLPEAEREAVRFAEANGWRLPALISSPLENAARIRALMEDS